MRKRREKRYERKVGSPYSTGPAVWDDNAAGLAPARSGYHARNKHKTRQTTAVTVFS